MGQGQRVFGHGWLHSLWMAVGKSLSHRSHTIKQNYGAKGLQGVAWNQRTAMNNVQIWHLGQPQSLTALWGRRSRPRKESEGERERAGKECWLAHTSTCRCDNVDTLEATPLPLRVYIGCCQQLNIKPSNLRDLDKRTKEAQKLESC